MTTRSPKNGRAKKNERSGAAKTPARAKNDELASASRLRAMFEALRGEGSDHVGVDALRAAIGRAGLRFDDTRLQETIRALDELEREKSASAAELDFEGFARVVKPSALLIEQALRQDLVIPEFDEFCDTIEELYGNALEDRSGAVADYIPQLGRVEPEQFGIGLCTIDGQRFALGESNVDFCLQSICKPINYMLALEQHGEDTVHQHIGCEPSGHRFNELTLNERGRPHNPMINAGAIMSCSLIRPDLAIADRFDYVSKMWRELAGGRKPGFSNATYLSERQTADRNFALGHFMRENGAFPEGTDLHETLEFYFQCCSIETTVESLSIVAATLANGGICPTTGKRVLQHGTVQRCLSLMYSCGLYDFSGEWAFHIGLPAKSGVSGAILIVVPNVLGLCTWSPRLDPLGNSVRGIAFCRDLVDRFNFHNYDNLAGGEPDKRDPRTRRTDTRNYNVDACWAASEGDLSGLRRLVLKGVELDAADYDGRTALHLAASEGHERVVAYFIERGVLLSPVDRWGGTPLDDAERGGHVRVAELLTKHGAERGREIDPRASG